MAEPEEHLTMLGAGLSLPCVSTTPTHVQSWQCQQWPQGCQEPTATFTMGGLQLHPTGSRNPCPVLPLHPSPGAAAMLNPQTSAACRALISSCVTMTWQQPPARG